MANHFKTCSIPECNGNASSHASGARGYCANHYYRLRTYGDPLGGGTSKGELIRFAEKVATSAHGEDCVNWPYWTGANGYGMLTVAGRKVVATRYICQLAHGAPPDDSFEAAHSCGNGHLGCINPNHLSWKSHIDNEADKKEHGTSNRGQRNGSAKLTEADAIAIFQLKGTMTQDAIASKFGVSRRYIGKIHAGQKWGWLTSG